MHRFVLYREDMTLSPNPVDDQRTEDLWIDNYGPNEHLRLEIAVYNLIQCAFKNFATAGQMCMRDIPHASAKFGWAWISFLSKLP